MPKVKIAELVLDYDLYPRHQIVAYNVQSIVRALRAGFSLPPVIADRKTKKVTDGFNRITAVGRVYGEGAEVEVEWRDYKSPAAMFEDAMLLNSGHGERLSSFDMARCAILAKDLGIQDAELARCLRATPEFMESLVQRKVAEGPDGPIAIKGTFADLAKAQSAAVADGRDPKVLSRRQVSANSAASGMPWWFLLDKIIGALEGGAVPVDNEKARERVERLEGLIASWRAKAARAA